jgi:hypothetical protein
MGVKGDNSKDFDLSYLSKGVYLIRVSGESKEMNILRIVLQ